MDGLSIAANAFAVVGVADVAIKGIATLMDLVGTFKEAPKKVERLQNEIKDLGNTIFRVRTFLTDFASSPASIQDNRSLDSFEPALQGCQQTLERLREILERLHVAPAGNFLEQLGRRSGYILSDEKIKYVPRAGEEEDNITDPQEAKEKAGEGNRVNPLDASPANPELSTGTAEEEGGSK